MAATNARLWLILLLALLLALRAGGVGAQPGAEAAPPVSLVLGPPTVALAGYYTLSLRLRGVALQQHSAFPELEGFRKSGKTSTTTTRVVAGRRFSELTISQRYVAYGEGEFSIKPFQLTVNGQLARSPGGRVRVLPGLPAASAAPFGPAAAPPPGPAAPRPPAAVGLLDQLLGKPRPALYTEPADHAFLAVMAEQPQVYVGQGVRVGLYFFLTPPDQALLAFHDYNDQLPALLRQLRQPGAWVVPAPEAAATPDSVRRGSQLYLRYRLAEGTYYPLTPAPLRFPPLALTMTKFRLLTRPEPGADNRLATYKTFGAAALTVNVRPLPPPPAATLTESSEEGAVLVGEYTQREVLSTRQPRVGQPFSYSFIVEGRGNLAALTAPGPPAPAGRLDVYGPTVLDQMLPNGRARKVLRYRLVPRRPGPVALDSLLAITTFDPRTARYLTLRPRLRAVALGAAVAASAPGRPADDPFYGPALAGANSAMQPLNAYEQARRGAGLLVLGLLGLAGFGWRRATVRAR